MNEVNVQHNYKDTIFRMLFKDKENLLSLYNALNKTAYTDVSGLEITTLENAVYMNYKNDVSFVFDFELMLYEHQSTVNPNMPLRDLLYVTSILQKRVSTENLYGSKQIKIPSPRFVVFYNGADYQPERQVLRLPDAYEKKQGKPELELTVTVYNINHGCNEEIMDACKTLNKKNRAEVIMLSIFEYDEQAHYKLLYEEGVEDGIEQGLSITIRNMLARGMSDEDIMAIAECGQELIEQVRERS